MSRETNEGVMMHCKSITANLLTIVGLLVENITSLAKPKASLEASLSIRKPPLTLTYSKPVISPSLSSLISFRSILRYNSRSPRSIGYWWSTVESYVGNSSGHCGGRNITGKMKFTSSIKCVSFIGLIKGRSVLFRGTSISLKIYFWSNLEQVVPIIIWYQSIFHGGLY